MKKIKIGLILLTILTLCVTLLTGCNEGRNFTLAKDIELSNGNKIIMDRNLILQAWAPSEASGELPIPYEDLVELGFGPTYYDGNFFNEGYHKDNAQWSIAKAPNDVNAINTLPDGNEWLTEEQLKYSNDLVSLCFGDEQAYSKDQVEMTSKWFDDFRTRNDNVLLHTNQWLNQWSRNEYKKYMKIAKPDLLTFDTYYFDQGDTKSSIKMQDYETGRMIADSLNTVRIPAMAGYDGKGTSPIPFGQYILGYKTGETPPAVGWYEITESQKNLVANLTLTMGGKWLNLFRIIKGEVFLFYNPDGSKTHHFYEYKTMMAEINNLSDHLIKLQTEDVRVVLGDHKKGNGSVKNKQPRSVNKFNKRNNYFIENISIKNLGVQNDGYNGDVFVGYFKNLPISGLDQNRNYFAICNGLAEGNMKRPDAQNGNSEQTKQEITLNLSTNEGKNLYMVNALTGESEKLNIVDGAVKITLGGGKMGLLYWA